MPFSVRFNTVLKGALIMFLFFNFPAIAAEHRPEEFLASIEGSSNVGKKIYDHFCSSCHANNPMIPVGAPRAKMKADWAPYTKNQSIDTMVKVIDTGLGAMPPRGGCFECSDQDLKAAIEYMLPNDTYKEE